MAELPVTAAATNFVAAIPRFAAIAAYTTLVDLEDGMGRQHSLNDTDRKTRFARGSPLVRYRASSMPQRQR
jgi:hypothetical protein